MPPRKRARQSHSPETEQPSASHLVSFLTGYAEREASSGSEGGSASEAEDDYEDPDEEEDTRTTPGKRGLVGTPGKRKTTGTPRKRATATATPTPRKKEKDEGFLRMSRADQYFLSSGRGSKTSGSSYAALAKPLSQAEYETAVNGIRGKEDRVVAALSAAELHFPQWVAELESGFNLLLYGYGSKRRLVNRFVKTLSGRGHCAVVNGHFPGLGLRDVLSALEDTLNILDTPTPPGSTPLERATHRIYTHFSTSPTPLFLILHNIDSPSLRTPKALTSLSQLASNPKIHILATFDHVHTPLLFPTSLTFNWIYHSTPTYDDYDIELSYARFSATATLGALGQGGATGVSEEGALQILRSVPPMAARLLKLILTRQRDALPPDLGMHAAFPPGNVAPPFALDVDLIQKMAKDKFIAREEERFNALIGEFRDHGLVVGAEVDAEGRGGRWAWVPLGRGAVERILGEMRDVE